MKLYHVQIHIDLAARMSFLHNWGYDYQTHPGYPRHYAELFTDKEDALHFGLSRLSDYGTWDWPDPDYRIATDLEKEYLGFYFLIEASDSDIRWDNHSSDTSDPALTRSWYSRDARLLFEQQFFSDGTIRVRYSGYHPATAGQIYEPGDLVSIPMNPPESPASWPLTSDHLCTVRNAARPDGRQYDLIPYHWSPASESSSLAGCTTCTGRIHTGFRYCHATYNDTIYHTLNYDYHDPLYIATLVTLHLPSPVSEPYELPVLADHETAWQISTRYQHRPLLLYGDIAVAGPDLTAFHITHRELL